MKKLQSVQVLRGVAACAVVALHAFSTAHDPVNSTFRIGASGVDLFFVISGFVIATIPKKSPGNFLFDRAWRIFPMWLIAVTPLLLWLPADWPTTLASLTLWPVYSRFTLPILPIGWTLSFEMLFYISTALALLTRPLVPLILFGIALVAGVATRLPIFDFVGNPMILEFLMGMAVAKLPRDARFGGALVILALALFAISPLQIYVGETAISAATSISRVVFWGFPAAALVYGMLCLEGKYRFAPILVLIGNASYSIYLFHIPIVQFAPFHWTVKLCAAIAGGCLIHLFVEQPIQRSRDAVKRLLSLRFGGVYGRNDLATPRSPFLK